MSVFVGLDCGGSSTRVLAVDQVGTVLFQGQSGPANLSSTPQDRLHKNLASASEGCPRADFVCGCFAGLVNESRRKLGAEELQRIFPMATHRAEPDYAAAYFAAPVGTDICVIAGTGSLVCSSKGGVLVKSGGRGFLLGDEGSSFQYGRDLVVQYLDEPSTLLKSTQEAIAARFGSSDPSHIVSAVYQAPSPATAFARLAVEAAKEAAIGNPRSIDSLNRHSNALAEIVVGHFGKFLERSDQIKISLTGGLWKAHALFREIFGLKLTEKLSGQTVMIARSSNPPVFGAVKLAKEMAIVN